MDVTQNSPFYRSGIKVQFKSGLQGSQYPNLLADPIGLVASDAGFQWYRSDLKQYRYWTGTTVSIIESSIGGDSLQSSYDGGSTITIAGGNPISISVPDTVNAPGLTINQNDVTNNPSAFTIANLGTGNDITSTNWNLTKVGGFSGVEANFTNGTYDYVSILKGVNGLGGGAVNNAEGLFIGNTTGSPSTATTILVKGDFVPIPGSKIMMLGIKKEATADVGFIGINDENGIDVTSLNTYEGVTIGAENNDTTAGLGFRVKNGTGGGQYRFEVDAATGAIRTTIDDNKGAVGLTINQNDVTNNLAAIVINNAGTGNDITANNWNVTSAGVATFAGMDLNFTPNSVLFVGSGGEIAQDNINFSWDDTAKTLNLNSNLDTQTGLFITNSNTGTSAQNGLYLSNSGGSVGGVVKISATHPGFPNDLLITSDDDISFWESSGTGVYKFFSGGTFDLLAQISTAGIVFNESGLDVDTRIEGTTDANLFFVDASANKIGIGTNTPTGGNLHIKTSTGTGIYIDGPFSDAGITLNSSLASGKRYTLSSVSDGSFRITDDIASANRLFISSTGKVGIGTITPVSKLDISVANTDNVVGLTINQNDVTNNPDALVIENAGTGFDIMSVNGFWTIDSVGKANFSAIVNEGAYQMNLGGAFAATYTVLDNDYVVISKYSLTGTQTINLPDANSWVGRILVIKDADGNAGVNNITIDGFGAQTIDGAATFVIDVNYGAVSLFTDGNNWFVY